MLDSNASRYLNRIIDCPETRTPDQTQQINRLCFCFCRNKNTSLDIQESGILATGWGAQRR